MVNITHKNNTLRKAIATAVVRVSAAETIGAIRNRAVPKGDVFEFSRAAGLLAIKKTSDVIPDCHPLPVEYAAIRYDIRGLELHISVEVHTIYKTGVEVEAMHGAAITALTIYDMLKPIDKSVEIGTVRLERKEGGKSSHTGAYAHLRAAVVVCSDRVAGGLSEDKSGQQIRERLAAWGMEAITLEVIPDEREVIQGSVQKLCAAGTDLVILTGGTGLSERDVTPDAVRPLLETDIPGIMEAARSYGQQRMAFSMLSRGVAGFAGNTLVMTFPGSEKAVREYMDALFPAVFHVFHVRKGAGHS